MGLATLLKRAAVDGVHSLFQVPPLEAALAQLTRDHKISHVLARLAPVNLNYAHPSYRNVERDGINFKLDISDYQDWLIFWGITTDRPEALYTLIRPDAVVFDVGSNIGDVCLNAASLVGPGGMVYAFEPDPISFSKLTTNLSLNRFGNIFASNLGLGAAPETLAMKVDCSTNRGGNRITRDSHAAQQFPILVETLDRFVAQRGIQRIDVIKIDVEGFELSVLEGARASIARFRPRMFIEMCDPNLRLHGGSAAQMVATLRAMDYRVFHAVSGQELDVETALPPLCDVLCRPAGA